MRHVIPVEDIARSLGLLSTTPGDMAVEDQLAKTARVLAGQNDIDIEHPAVAEALLRLCLLAGELKLRSKMKSMMSGKPVLSDSDETALLLRGFASAAAEVILNRKGEI